MQMRALWPIVICATIIFRTCLRSRQWGWRKGVVCCRGSQTSDRGWSCYWGHWKCGSSHNLAAYPSVHCFVCVSGVRCPSFGRPLPTQGGQRKCRDNNIHSCWRDCSNSGDGMYWLGWPSTSHCTKTQTHILHLVSNTMYTCIWIPMSTKMYICIEGGKRYFFLNIQLQSIHAITYMPLMIVIIIINNHDNDILLSTTWFCLFISHM